MLGSAGSTPSARIRWSIWPSSPVMPQSRVAAVTFVASGGSAEKVAYVGADEQCLLAGGVLVDDERVHVGGGEAEPLVARAAVRRCVEADVRVGDEQPIVAARPRADHPPADIEVVSGSGMGTDVHAPPSSAQMCPPPPT